MPQYVPSSCSEPMKNANILSKTTYSYAHHTYYNRGISKVFFFFIYLFKTLSENIPCFYVSTNKFT